jgi:predicted small metal-binding protein
MFCPHLTGFSRCDAIISLVRGERGRRISMKAMLCGCGKHLEAANDEGLVREALTHRRQEHTMYVADAEPVRRAVKENAYRLEYAAPYAYVYGEGPDEEFGLEPY